MIMIQIICLQEIYNCGFSCAGSLFSPPKGFPSPASGRGVGEGMFSTENRPSSGPSGHLLPRRGEGTGFFVPSETSEG